MNLLIVSPRPACLTRPTLLACMRRMLTPNPELNPCPIVSPVGWLGLPESIWALHGLQSSFIPPPPQPEKPKTGGMTLRKRKATAAATSNNAPEEEVALRVSPRKRQRTTRAQAALAQAEVAPPVSAPTSMLLDIPASGAVAADAGATSKAMKQDLLRAEAGGTRRMRRARADGPRGASRKCRVESAIVCHLRRKVFLPHLRRRWFPPHLGRKGFPPQRSREGLSRKWFPPHLRSREGLPPHLRRKWFPLQGRCSQR